MIIAPAILALVVLASAALADGRASGETVVAALGLLLVVVLALVATQRLVGQLTRLRDSALTAANRVLPERIEQIRASRDPSGRTPEELIRDAADPVAVPAHDELGQVAYAVNTMYQEALRAAAGQARQRGELDTLVSGLARRSQALVDKMATVLRDIERAETDPERLTRLFELDRLATLMKRNDENLLLLAGADAIQPQEKYLLLTEIVEAARGEVEQHGRVDPGTVDDDVAVNATAAGDVVRLIAELIDNATRFSPPSTAVLVDGRRIGDYVLIEIEDRGLGMTQAQLDAYNQRLAAPPPTELTEVRLMGLAVVARLAERHQIRVTLRANSDRGTVASVTLPTAVLVLPSRRFDRALPPRRVPELPAAAPPGWPLAGTAPPGALAPALPSAGGPGLSGIASPVAAAGTAGGRQVQQILPGGPGALPKRTNALPAGPARPGDERFALPAAPAHAATEPGRPAAHATPGSPLPRHTELGPALALPAGEPAPPRLDGNSGPVVGDGDEPVIFKEMQARWFGVPQPPRAPATGDGGTGTALLAGTGYPLGAVPGRSVAAGKEPTELMDDEYGWRSAADDGWRAATAAAQPTPAGTTESGLPRRQPAAHLVPGAVPFEAPPGKRDPDEVRGTLAAYHRGVQRGRGGSEAQSSGHPRSADEEMHS